MSTGSPWDRALSAGIGMALAARADKKDYRTYVDSGGRRDRGGAGLGGGHGSPGTTGLDHLTAIVDYNKLQVDGSAGGGQCHPAPSTDKFEAFKWEVLSASTA